jgi:hypothetical protein
MLTEKDYCDYNTCVALKELGYKTPASAFYMPNNETLCFVSNPYRGGYVIDCFRSHNSLREDVMTHDFIDAPTMWEAQKWLREKGIFVHISYPLRVENDVFWNYEVLDEAWDEGKQNPCICASGGLFDSHEEALLRGVRQAVNLLKENK